MLIGTIHKPSGIKGLVSVRLLHEIKGELTPEFLLIEIEDQIIPFETEELKYIDNKNAVIKLRGIDSVGKAKTLINLNVYRQKSNTDVKTETHHENLYLLKGFSVFDKETGLVGTIQKVLEFPQQVLFEVKGQIKVHLLPANEKTIVLIDKKNRIVKMDLPEGLLFI